MPEIHRCRWVNLANPAYVRYHDLEWGRPHYDDAYLFELLLLESFQAGLSWECILNKREAFRRAFDGFDPQKIAAYDAEKCAALLAIQAEWGSFSEYLWHFTGGNVLRDDSGIPRATSPLSDAVSVDLRARGMKFVGSTIIYSYLQAAGIVNDHERGCAFAE